MHFRQFLISGIIIGTTMFLSDIALAEKNGQAALQETPKVGAQASAVQKVDSPLDHEVVPVKVEKSTSQDNVIVKNGKLAIKPKVSNPTKETKALPASIPKNQGKELGQAFHHSKKAISKLGIMPNQAKITVPAGRGEKKGLVKNKQASIKKGAEVSPEYSLHHHFEESSQAKKLAKSSDVIRKKENRTGPFLPDTDQEKSTHGKQASPKGRQVANSPQRTNNSGSQSSDRISQGYSNLSIDKWIEWNKYYENQLILPFISRQILFSNQWVNAPPSPPPQKAPFFLTLNRFINKG